MITKQEFETMNPGCGGDCWNDLYCYRQAFKHPNVAAVIDLQSVGTGLYRDVLIQTETGDIRKIRIFG